MAAATLCMVSNHKTLPLSAWFQKQLNNVFMPFRFGNWQWCLTSLSGKTMVLLTAFTYDPGWDSESKHFHARPYIMMWLFTTTNRTKLQATCSKLNRKYFICCTPKDPVTQIIAWQRRGVSRQCTWQELQCLFFKCYQLTGDTKWALRLDVSNRQI